MDAELGSGSTQRRNFRRGIRAFTVAAISAGIVAMLPRAIPGFEIGILAHGTAWLASLLTGSPAVPIEGGYALPAATVPVLVTPACSAADFCVMLAALLGWHAARRLRAAWTAVPIAAFGSLPLGLAVNALRIAALAQAHRWIIPHFPTAYAHFLHLLIGVAVFVPALVALNLLFERYGRHCPTRRH